ncbi:hypothetical protein, partial [Clostridioides difficile]
TEKKSSDIARALTNGLKGLDDQSLTMMRGLNDNMAIILSGVTADMKPSDKVNKITKNLDDAFKAGKLSAQEYRSSI